MTLSDTKNKTIPIVLTLLAITALITLIYRYLPGKRTEPITETSKLPGQIKTIENEKYSFNSELPFSGDGFKIEFPSYNTYTVYLNSENDKNKAIEWFKSKGVNPSSLNIKFITQSEESNIEKLLKTLPNETADYNIYFSARTEKFVIELKNPSGQEKVTSWLKSQRIDDLNKLTIDWIKYYE